MAYFNNDFDNLFNELNSSFFNDDFGKSNGSIPIHYSSNMSGATPQTMQQVPQGQKEKPIGVDLVEQAKSNKFDPVIGRDEQIDNVIEILSRRKKNNPVLIGPAGVGKTSIVEGLAQRIAEGNVPAKMKDMHIIAVNINDMVAGSSLRGSFEERLKKHIDLLMKRYPSIASCKQDIINAYLIMEECYEHDGKLLIAGNGGSAADSEHIAGELMKRFKTPRPVTPGMAEKLKQIDPVRGEDLAKNLERGLMAIPLVAHEALSTAYINDVDGLGVFAQQLFGFGREGDVFLGISTSGNSKNVMSATVVARALGIRVIGLTGAKGGELAEVADVIVRVPETETYMIQELHLPIYHCWCLMLEDKFFGK